MANSDVRTGNTFLDGIALAFVRRRKAINHRGGELHIELLFQADEVCLSIRFVPKGTDPVVILEAVVGNRLNLYLRSAWNARRGRMLLRLDDLRVVDNPRKIVETFEWTIAAAWRSDPAEGADETKVAVIERRWQQLALRTIP